MDKPKLKKIIEKNLEGNYLIGALGRKALLLDIIEWHKEQLAIDGVSNSLPTNDVDEINGNFAQAERALLRIDPSGESPDPTEIHELLQWFRDKLLGNDC